MSSDASAQERSSAARAAAGLALVSVALVVIGAAAANLRLLSPFGGFRLFGLGLLLAVAALIAGIVGLVRTRASTGRAGRRAAALGAAWGVVGVVLIGVGGAPARGKPRINDVTTDPDAPPSFDALARAEANTGRDMSYPTSNAAEQRGGYPDLKPIALTAAPKGAAERSKRAAEALGWTVVRSDETGLEATHESGLFRFVDDVVVHVAAAPGGSIVDVRSKSRDGKGDLGVNAARIRAFRTRLLAGGK